MKEKPGIIKKILKKIALILDPPEDVIRKKIRKQKLKNEMNKLKSESRKISNSNIPQSRFAVGMNTIGKPSTLGKTSVQNEQQQVRKPII